MPRKPKTLTADEMFGAPARVDAPAKPKKPRKPRSSVARTPSEETSSSEVTKTYKNPNLIEASKPYRWQPGQSGNPKGRPIGSTELTQRAQSVADMAFNVLEMTARFQYRRLQKALDVAEDPASTLEDVEKAAKVVEKAKTGLEACKAILERAHGKVPQKVELDAHSFLDTMSDERLEKYMVDIGMRATSTIAARRKAKDEGEKT